ncbi:MAG: glycosyltransferase family 39 protein [Limnothrix sp. BL-A-16]
MADPNARAPRWLVWGSIGLITIGCLLRFSDLGQFLPWYDEFSTLRHIANQTDPELIQQWGGREQVMADLWRSLAAKPGKTAWDTVQSLASANAHHPPLYYLLARGWAHWFGNNIVSLRMVTALMGVALLPSVFWLLRQLSDRPSLPWIGTVLVALSPLQILYAQEAREYAIWLVFVVLSSGFLARSLRNSAQNSVQKSTGVHWLLYGITLTLNWYSHLLGGLVLLGHGLWVGVWWWRSGDRHWRRVIPWAIAVSGTLLAMSPWLWTLFQVREGAVISLEWLNQTYQPGMQRWSAMRAFAATLWDNQPNIWIPASRVVDSIRLGVLVLSVGALVHCGRSSEPMVKRFVFSTIAPFFLLLWLPAIVMDRAMATIIRYQLPLIIGVQVALADGIAALCDQLPPKPGQELPQPLWFYLCRWRWMPQLFASSLAILLVVANLNAAKVRSSQLTWWSKGGPGWVEVAKALKEVDRPLIVMTAVPGYSSSALSLSYASDRLKARNISFWLAPSIQNLNWPERSNTFVLVPGKKLPKAIEQRGQRLVPFGASWWNLWRLESATPDRPST